MSLPPFEFKVSLGNVLSGILSLVSIGTVVVAVATYGATMRAEVNKTQEDQKVLAAELREIRATLAARNEVEMQRNERTLELLTELKTSVTYMTAAIARLERREENRR